MPSGRLWGDFGLPLAGFGEPWASFDHPLGSLGLSWGTCGIPLGRLLLETRMIGLFRMIILVAGSIILQCRMMARDDEHKKHMFSYFYRGAKFVILESS